MKPNLYQENIQSTNVSNILKCVVDWTKDYGKLNYSTVATKVELTVVTVRKHFRMNEDLLQAFLDKQIELRGPAKPMKKPNKRPAFTPEHRIHLSNSMRAMALGRGVRTKAAIEKAIKNWDLADGPLTKTAIGKSILQGYINVHNHFKKDDGLRTLYEKRLKELG